MRRFLLLDLDGTLVDSVPDLQAAINRALDARGLTPLGRDEVASMVGDGVQALVERAFAARGAPADPEAVPAFLADYGAHAAVGTRLYPDAENALRRMAADGWGLAVCTNKPEALARRLLGDLGVGELFAAIGGGDSFRARKPDPLHLLETLRAAGGQPDRAVSAGDHPNDMAAAQGAGLPSIFVRWGYGRIGAGARPTAWADRFADLPAIAARLLPP